MKSVAVIGGGAAGLSAALRLAVAGVQVTVYEREPEAGGRMRTVQVGDAQADVGVQMVSSTQVALAELNALSGATSQMQRSPGRDALWRRDRAHAITYGSVTSMATSSAIPTTLKLRLAGQYLPFLSSQGSNLDANDPARGGVPLDVTSIAEWGQRQLGNEFVDLLVYPLLAAYYGALPEETSAPVYHALARVGLEVNLLASTSGFGGLAGAWAAALEERGGRIVRNAQVRSVTFDATAAGTAGGVHVQASGAAEFDAVVMAVPAPVAADLLAEHAAVANWLREVRTRRACTVAFRLSAPLASDWFGLSFPRGSGPGRDIAAICVQSRKLPGLVQDGDVVVALPAPMALEALYERSDEDVAYQILDAVERAVPGFGAQVTAAHVARFAHGYTLFGPGQLRRIARGETLPLPSKLALAGDYMIAPSVEGAVRSGANAAERVLRAL